MLKIFIATTFVVLLELSAAAGQVTYNYDDAGRLKSASYVAGGEVTYNYDPAGNIVHRSVATSPTGPVLTVEQAPGHLTVLRWLMAGSDGFKLQTTPSLSGNITWTTLVLEPATAGLNYAVTNNAAPPNRAAFFRLVREN